MLNKMIFNRPEFVSLGLKRSKITILNVMFKLILAHFAVFCGTFEMILGACMKLFESLFAYSLLIYSAGIGVLNAARKTMARMLGNNESAFGSARSQFWVVDAKVRNYTCCPNLVDLACTHPKF